MTFFRFSFTLSVIVQCDISLSLYQTYCYAICWIFWIYSEWKYKEPLKIVICCVDISIQLNGTLHFLARLIKRNSLDYADKHVNFYHVTHLLTLTEWLKRMLSKPSKKKQRMFNVWHFVKCIVNDGNCNITNIFFNTVRVSLEQITMIILLSWDFQVLSKLRHYMTQA